MMVLLLNFARPAQIHQEGEGFFDRRNFQPIADRLAVALGADQFGLLQRIEMAGDGRPTHVESGGDVAGRKRPLAQHGDDAPSHRMGQGLEQAVHRQEAN